MPLKRAATTWLLGHAARSFPKWHMEIAAAGPHLFIMANRTASGSPRAPAAIVFGASGAIGGAVTRALLARRQAGDVHAGSRSADSALPREAVPFRFDLTLEASIAAAARTFPAPELVFVATGFLHEEASGIMPEKTFRAVDAEAMARLYAVNAIGPALIAKHLLPLLPRDRRAVFAVLSARVGSITDNCLGGWHAYRASKAALNMIVRNLAIELARSHPLAVIAALHPGTVDSRLSEPFQRGLLPGKLFSPTYAAQKLLQVVDGLRPQDSGGLFAWDGTRIPA